MNDSAGESPPPEHALYTSKISLCERAPQSPPAGWAGVSRPDLPGAETRRSRPFRTAGGRFRPAPRLPGTTADGAVQAFTMGTLPVKLKYRKADIQTISRDYSFHTVSVYSHRTGLLAMRRQHFIKPTEIQLNTNLPTTVLGVCLALELSGTTLIKHRCCCGIFPENTYQRTIYTSCGCH